MYLIEAKATGPRTYFGHHSSEHRFAVCMAAAASELRGVNIFLQIFLK
jgi:hypothetical protein